MEAGDGGMEIVEVPPSRLPVMLLSFNLIARISACERGWRHGRIHRPSVFARLLRPAVVTEGVLDREPDYPVEGQENRREGHRRVREFAEEVRHKLIQAAFRLSPANTRAVR
jgi:hypothetical protein